MTERAGGSRTLRHSAVVCEAATAISGDSTATNGSVPPVDGDFVLLPRVPRCCQGLEGARIFLMPRRLENGERNSYRVARLKDKFGSARWRRRSRAEGAIAYQLGALDRGLRQMMDMVNSAACRTARRAAGMMRRCSTSRCGRASSAAFGKPIIEHPLLAAAS